MINFTPEMIEKAKAAKSAEEPLVFEKENSAELSDDELGNVAGGTILKPIITDMDGEVLFDDELDNVTGGTGITSQETESSTEPYYAGGIVGYQDGQVTITNCSNTGTITNN